MNTACFAIAIFSLALFGFTGQNSSKTPDLSELGWISGSWAGAQDAVEMEEMWQTPKANSMLGVHRDVVKNRTVSFEFLRIEATASGITYWGGPEGKPPTPFRLMELKNKRVVFENPEHDFPQRIIYWLSDDGALHARIEGTENGKSSAMEWTWQRAK